MRLPAGLSPQDTYLNERPPLLCDYLDSLDIHRDASHAENRHRRWHDRCPLLVQPAARRCMGRCHAEGFTDVLWPSA
jgi:hypothetical protein